MRRSGGRTGSDQGRGSEVWNLPGWGLVSGVERTKPPDCTQSPRRALSGEHTTPVTCRRRTSTRVDIGHSRSHSLVPTTTNKIIPVLLPQPKQDPRRPMTTLTSSGRTNYPLLSGHNTNNDRDTVGRGVYIPEDPCEGEWSEKQSHTSPYPWTIQGVNQTSTGSDGRS